MIINNYYNNKLQKTMFVSERRPMQGHEVNRMRGMQSQHTLVEKRKKKKSTARGIEPVASKKSVERYATRLWILILIEVKKHYIVNFLVMGTFVCPKQCFSLTLRDCNSGTSWTYEVFWPENYRHKRCHTFS